MKVYRNVTENGVTKQIVIFDIAECTYSGKDMGERSITASIKWASPIDFKIGDYVMLQMQSLVRGANGVNGSILGGDDMERFYIYTMPTVKKNARPLSAGNAFEHTVTFYPAQYELGLVQMRDFGQETTNADSIIYTGFDTLTFVGGADELMRRIMTVLKEAYHDKDGQPLWSYKIADAANENKNTALERIQFSFSGNSVMDALLKLNDKDGLNTSFFINGRIIYVGFKRPYFCRVTDGKTIDTTPTTQMFQFEYGKTSNKPIAINNGGLYSITKSLGKESPITKLFAYGASRNLNRYYCSDRIQSGRYVNRLMLPSFDADGKTDYILSEDAIKKYGIREGSKQFEEIYPSLRYMTYGDLRQIKYCIKIKGSGLTNDKLGQNTSSYPVARVQCYKVVPSGVTAGINKLVEAAPPDDLCVIVHAMGKTVKVVLYGGTTDAQAIAKQREHDQRVPTRTINGTDYIPGSCFLVHDRGFDSNKTYACANRYEWFTNPNNSSGVAANKKSEIDMNQIQYEDTFWLSDVYVFESYNQTHFSRDGYSAGAWARTTTDYQGGSPDSMAVNEVVGVEPIVIEDTSSNVDDLTTQQKTFDIYLRDVGFKIDEQNDFGDMTFVVGTELKISMLDGLMAGREFTAAGTVVDSQYTCICAYKDDGSLNDDFFMDSDYNKGNTIPQAALEAGAIWRICLNRINLDEADYSNLNIILPTKDLCVKKGDHLVFLDIFMPDIYIHAAENRLLREARKYLDANDSGSVTYSAVFDKVRMQQIPNYALQLREGLNIRMVDDDLDISTENNGRYLADYRDKNLYSQLDIPYTRNTWEYVTEYKSASVNIETAQTQAGTTIQLLVVEIVLQYDETWIDRNPIQLIQDDTIYTLGNPFQSQSFGWSSTKNGYVYKIYYSNFPTLNPSADLTIQRHRIKTDSSYQKSVWLSVNDAIDFTRNRFYTLKCSIPDKGYLATSNAIALLSAKNDGIGAAKFLPTYTLQSERKEGEHKLFLTISFELPGNFSDDVVYYPSLLFNTDGRESRVSLYTESLYERDFSDSEAQLNYADFTIDTLSIKITDSNSSEPIRDITATFSENPAATAWASLMSRIEETQIEGEQNTKAIETMVNTARKNYQTLLNLKNSIFDPDGTCDQTFLQVMMMQVGADSMNYQLDKTRTGLSSGGQQVFHNCSLTKSGSVWTFKVLASDTLRHFVYTQGSQSGTWLINSGIAQALDGKSNYFVCAKCSREGSTGKWICSSKQYAVNDDEDTTAWFFNWGILTVDSGGNYTLVETRGNAYMYGDNLVCGKISTLAGNSYFDLTHGDFVLSNGASKALSYENGILTIGGVNDDSVDSILTRLGITESTANAAKTAANEANAEAEKVRAEYRAAITAEEQARNTAITSVQNSIGSLQNQIDGEVTAWFLKGVPTLDNQPAADWKVLNDNGKVDTAATELEYKRHEGDTYTNMSSYEEDSENAGKSWRFCKGAEDTSKSGWHWHLIADSDAVKALVEAGKAQSTADGKSTTFVKKPTSYQVGDLWILQADTDHAGGKKGDILTANVSSETYNANHWSKDVKYTDDTAANQAISDAANAKSAADNAKSVADAATTRLNNWAEDGVISPAEKQGIKDEIARIDADKSHITSEYTKYGLGTPTAFNTAHTDYRAILVTLSSSATETIAIPSNFSTKQTAYYNARTAALTAISTKADETAKAYADTVSASAAQAALDNLEIGGRNLLKNSQIGYWYGDYNTNGEFLRTIEDNRVKLVKKLPLGEYNSIYALLSPAKTNLNIKAGETYTFQVEMECDKALPNNHLFVRHCNKDNSINDAYGYFTVPMPTNTPTQCVLTCTFKKDVAVDEYLYFVFETRCTDQITLYVTNTKIEKGNKPTDWTPAPEDVEASIAENKTYADGIVKALGENLQNQIDGVVDSYFREGAPTATNYPANEWTTDELKQRHEGDTYTDITDFVDNDTTPTAGMSWRWCKGTSDSPVTTWHWHKIADSDAVRALQDAAKAQDTADGKRRVFITQPTPPYDKGDLWAQGSADGQEIKRCMTARATGSYNASDWQSASSALSKATAAANEAATAKTNAQTALTTLGNIASDTVLTKQEKVAVRTEWASIQAEFTKNTANAKVCWGDTGYSSNTDYKTYSTAYSALNTYLTSTAKINDSTDTTIVPANFNSAFSNYYGANVVLLNAIAKRVSELEVEAMEVGVRNLFAKKYMLDWNNNSAGTTTLNTDTNGTYYAIAENQLYHYTAGASNYNDILQGKVTFGTNKQYCLKVKWRVASVQTANGLYLGFKYTDGTRSSWIICAKDQTTPVEAQLISAKDKTVAGVVCTFGTIANTRIYEIQLTEGNKAPSGWIEAEEDKETGGENLYTGANPLTIAANASINYNYISILSGLQNSSKYVFSCGKSVVKAGSTTQYAVLLYDFANSTSTQQRLLPVGSTRVEQAFTVPSTGTWSMLIYSGVNGSTAGVSMEYTDIMVQKGNKATAYQTALSFLGKAIQDMSTDVAGGLLMTGVMMLKDTDNKTVTAGMSGLTTDDDGNKDNVLLWGGGTYPEAFYASRNTNYKKSASGSPITTLLKKDGTGKIGIFKISDDSVIVDNGGAKTVITNQSASEYSKTIGFETVVKDFAQTSQGATSYNTVIAEKTFSGSIYCGVAYIRGITFYCTAQGTYGGSLSSNSGATLSISVTVYNQLQNKDVTYDLITKTVSDTDTNVYYVESVSRQLASYEKLKSYKIELKNASIFGTGSIYCSFRYFIGAKDEGRMCVLAKDGIILSSGIGQQFIVRPNSATLDVIADIPVIKTKSDVKALQAGQLYTDSSGIVRRLSEEEAYQIVKDGSVYTSQCFTSLNRLLQSESDTTHANGYFSFLGFDYVGKQNKSTDKMTQFKTS